MKRPLENRIACVTGASRGLGKGIALQLADAGAIVYITARTLRKTDGVIGSLEETENEIKLRGGKCITVQVDHECDKDVESLFKKIELEQNGQLDILVNNAFKGLHLIFENRHLNFWEMNNNAWDEINNVGLRGYYICTVFASRLMTKRRTGLIVFVSSLGGLKYFLNVPYGVGKASVDRMAIDCGVELKNYNIASISLHVSSVRTENLEERLSKMNNNELFHFGNGLSISGEIIKAYFKTGQSIEFSGKCLVKLATDKDIMKLTSKIIIAEDYGHKHNIKDVDNRIIPSFRQLNHFLSILFPNSLCNLVNWVPSFIKVPIWLIVIASSKF